MGIGENLMLALKNYWKIIFLIIYPFVLLPIFLVEDKPANRCIYVITLMGGYWVLEILPLAITGLIPVALFPLMSILPTKQTASCYLTEPSGMFVGSYLLSLAVQESNLHIRISLNILKLVGFSPKLLHLLFTCVTLFMSIWISSASSTALMIPIVHTTLIELEGRNMGKVYKEGSFEEDEADVLENKRRPSKSTMAYFISLAYASLIGRTGYFISHTSNTEFIKLYESKTSRYLNSGMWFALSIPYMLITIGLTILWIQFFYLGLFRPNSSDAQDLRGTSDEEKAPVKDYVSEKLQSLGRMTFHEIAVSISVAIAMLFWAIREPIFMLSWSQPSSIKPATIIILIIIIMFLVPRMPVFFYVFSSDEEKIPKENSQGLLMWKYAVRKIPWMVLFLIGGAEAIAKGAYDSGLSNDIRHGLEIFETHTYFSIYCLLPLIAISMTQLTNSNAIWNILITVLLKISKSVDIHPISIMLPTFFSTSFCYLLPVSAPQNAMVADFINMKTLEIIKIGIVVLIISYLVLLILSSFAVIKQ